MICASGRLALRFEPRTSRFSPNPAASPLSQVYQRPPSPSTRLPPRTPQLAPLARAASPGGGVGGRSDLSLGHHDSARIWRHPHT
eukprot:14511609-Alexandrium_andersonii.AAC.1